MAQPESQTTTDPESPGQGMVRVEVGTRILPTTKRDLPEQIGGFEHHAATNFRTAMWARRFFPAGPKDGHIKETYSVTCEGGQWHITRGVVLREPPRAGMGVVESVLTVETVREGFESFADAIDAGERIMEAASRRSVEYPADVPESLAKAFEAVAEEAS